MVDHFSLAFGTPSQAIMAEYDARTDDALARLVATNAVQLLVSMRTKPWPNGSSSGAASFLGPKRLKTQGLITAFVGCSQLLEPEEYADSVRLRLGCAAPCEPVPCAACQPGSLDTGAAHATCCALGEATPDHNGVPALVHAAAQSCDSTALESSLAPI